MEDDDIDYEITFPSPVSPDIDDDVGVDNINLLDKKEPVVILLGWLGCKEKHMAKYGQIYDQKGCITVRYTAPGEVIYYDVSKLKNIACKLLDLLDDYYIQDNPVIFHIFSNNGCYVYSNVVKVLTGGDKRYQNLQVCGVVIDSAPGRPRLLRAAHAHADAQNVGIFKYYFLWISMLLYLIFKHAKSWLLAVYDKKHTSHEAYFLYDTMKHDRARWPQMFFYSIADKLIPFSDVEEIVQHRQDLGIHVDSMCWEGSEHVSHYRAYPEQYREACWDFLAFCLGGINGEMDEESVDSTEDYLLVSKK